MDTPFPPCVPSIHKRFSPLSIFHSSSPSWISTFSPLSIFISLQPHQRIPRHDNNPTCPKAHTTHKSTTSLNFLLLFYRFTFLRLIIFTKKQPNTTPKLRHNNFTSMQHINSVLHNKLIRPQACLHASRIPSLSSSASYASIKEKNCHSANIAPPLAHEKFSKHLLLKGAKVSKHRLTIPLQKQIFSQDKPFTPHCSRQQCSTIQHLSQQNLLHIISLSNDESP